MGDLGSDYEIIVVDDGSTDKTVDTVLKFGDKVNVIRQNKNIGKGAAVRRGMLEAKGNIRLFSDADLSTPITELPKLLECLNNGTDICIGSRAVDNSKIRVHQPFYREFMGKTFNKLVQLLVFRGINDTQCGFKVFNDYAADKIFPSTKIDGFGFDVELIYLAHKAGFKVEEVPVEWYNDARSTVNPLFDSARMIIDLWNIRRIHRH
jgi:dolichyl-phosphate beta-glucosyltransferase